MVKTMLKDYIYFRRDNIPLDQKLINIPYLKFQLIPKWLDSEFCSVIPCEIVAFNWKISRGQFSRFIISHGGHVWHFTLSWLFKLIIYSVNKYMYVGILCICTYIIIYMCVCNHIWLIIENKGGFCEDKYDT